MQAGRRPVFLNLLQIRFPVTAITSILHRISGLLLFFLIPFMILLLQMSLRSADDFNMLLGWFDRPYIKAIMALALWSVVHHLLAGVRYLFLDFDIGVSRQAGRKTAWSVNLLAVAITIVIVGATV